MLWWKAIHIIAVISWMAGLLYLFRLFVYHNEEKENVVKERFQMMERKLLNIITTPAGILSVVSGIMMMTYQLAYYFSQKWFHLKLALVVLLLGMHRFAFYLMKKLATTPNPYKKAHLRILNEVPTLLMILIVLLVVLKPF
ncbi:MAG: TIGR00701 family protein [Deltaproteobacteria bacterium RIFCSPLOWO2_12_FULL_44_12]|nr:MAG: TIGR00701 family protein [Deltaproteobacteria bacterium RIFCSPHIGHO2_01_FULL_43_49]OGQ14450.1 MAG: TIGR00701 family protein [Deltaproteobacteria bacterium RIFCSPHIGHO2_02_FULL_44_53]OGQ27831.1 MAG: TIGR00701 family protein [Deltaproteobacteria bacterium RIFCSPHIGHO2_12_FULL_44_21]OGQ30907.1 MAG: TIGR00701 family protein [Deltaproteobacteria bacterium RIFCSPLOWO2_01_FULL_45_74]OGQ42567.1 MAG: TIGR00701 family protein [Deltaproteobacteria bacterium RIFCSPLOWO2_02_FULL_44_34]OGQ69412.1 MA